MHTFHPKEIFELIIAGMGDSLVVSHHLEMKLPSFSQWYNPDLATLMARQTWISWILCHKFRWLISQYRPLNKLSLTTGLCCIYTGWLDVIQLEKWMAHAAVCSAPQQPELIPVQMPDTLHSTHSWDFKTFMVVVSAEVTYKHLFRTPAQCVCVCVCFCVYVCVREDREDLRSY